MLIELNRLLTTDEVVSEYRIRSSMVDGIVSNLPVFEKLEDGSLIHLEKDVDDYLSELSLQRRKLSQPEPDMTRSKDLNETESNILEALGDDKLTGEQLAKKAGYTHNSHFKSTLSSMVKRKLLVNDHPGYRKP